MRAIALCLAASVSLWSEDPPMPKPDAHHLAMKAAEGTWDAVVKIHMGPGKPPVESKGVEVNKVVAGGFWLQSEFTSEMMGQPFEGRGLFGYDPMTKRHVGTWVDSMSTMQSISSGTCKDGCKEIVSTFKGLGPDNKMTTYREVSVQTDADHRSMTMFMKGKDGKFHQNMEITYTRRK